MDGLDAERPDGDGEHTDSPARRAREDARAQQFLFEGADVPAWREHWWGMPSFEMRDALPAHRVTVNFVCFEDMEEFALRLGIKMTRRTDSLWFPPESIDAPSEWEYAHES